MRKLVFLIWVMTLSACMDRAHSPVMPEALKIGMIHRVFVATHRKPEAGGWFTNERDERLNYTTVDVSVPPSHARGQVSNGFDSPDPTTDFTIASRHDSADRAIFRSELAKSIAARPKGDREVTLYIHGYNNSFFDGVFRTAQLMHDFDLPGTAVHYSWPSATNPLGYTYDRDSVLFTRDKLEELLQDIRAAGPSRIVVIGHSLGTMLLMETLRQIEIREPGWSKKNLSGVILIAPDLDVDLFKTQAARFKELPQPFAIFVSQRDRALQLSARINGVSARLGTMTDASQLADFPVTLVDVTEFAQESGSRHFTAGTSPILIALISRSQDLDRAFQRDRAGKSGLLPGTVITVRNATALILSPHLVMQKKD